MSKILAVLRKELYRFFTDRRMLISLIVPGLLIFVIYSLIGNVVTNSMNNEITEYNIYVLNEPTEMNFIYYNPEWTVHKNSTELTENEIISEVVDGTVDLYIIYEENFMEKIGNYDSETGDLAPSIAIYYNSTVDSSYNLYLYVTAMLDQYEMKDSNKFDINYNDDIKYDLATDADISVKIIGMILPFILMSFLISGATGVCSEAIAGEKERGTMATLLVTPVKRSHIVIGKLAALGITAIFSSFVSFLGLILSLPKLVGTSFSISNYGIGPLLLLLLAVMVTTLFFTTILTIISTYAKSVKEATSLSLPLTVIVMVVGVTGMMSNSADANLGMYALPIYNSIQVFTGILNQSFDIWSILITIISNLTFVGLGVFVLTKMFDNEKIMFNK